jgi:excinuclease ABC subunit C
MARTPAGTPPHPKGAERFHEERATYALQGSAQPDLEAGVAAIREVVRTLKPKPGSTACSMRAATCSTSARRAR